MIKLKLGISTCPNDTFIFGALLRNDIKHSFNINITLDDVQFLNEWAIKNEPDVVKVSFGVYPEICKNYKILKSGGALGFGCGPLLLSKKNSSIKGLKNKKIAVPGKNTTAFMIFKKFFPDLTDNIIELRFDKIIPAILAGECDGGLVIHEGRFIYQNYSLNKIIDLGSLWEERFSCPIPLGFIAVKNELTYLADEINASIRSSIEYARNNEVKTYEFVKKYACDMEDNVVKSHVGLYVNEYSMDLSRAIKSISILLHTDSYVFV